MSRQVSWQDGAAAGSAHMPLALLPHDQKGGGREPGERVVSACLLSLTCAHCFLPEGALGTALCAQGVLLRRCECVLVVDAGV